VIERAVIYAEGGVIVPGPGIKESRSSRLPSTCMDGPGSGGGDPVANPAASGRCSQTGATSPAPPRCSGELQDALTKIKDYHLERMAE
jgi:hypothetical protein